jgi:hypothetical protein
LAAKMAVGMADDKKVQPLNLTQLRKRNRKKTDKTARRKRPHVDDTDVIAAPDANPGIAVDALLTDDNVEPADRPMDIIVEPDSDPGAAYFLCHSMTASIPSPLSQLCQQLNRT